MGWLVDLGLQFGIGLTVFASSNVDDLVLLAALFSTSAFKTRSVVAGQFLGIGALVLVSAVAALTAGSLPPIWIRLLGIFPIGIGLHQLIQRRGERSPESQVDEPDFDVTRGAQILAVAGMTAANGGDNLGIYVPLFAAAPDWIPFFTVLFAGLTAAWCWLAFGFATHPLTASHLAHHSRRWLPLILMGLGIYILMGTPALA